MFNTEHNNRYWELLVHLVFWMVLCIAVFLWFFINKGSIWIPTYYHFLLLCPFFLIFLINNFLLVPFLYFRHNWKLLYLVVAAAVIFIVFRLYSLLFPDATAYYKILNHSYNPQLVTFFRWINATLMVLLNLAIKILFKTAKDKERVRHWEKNHLEAELNYLRYQINPHFFLNTLNNIYALIEIDPEKARMAVLDFSKLMRYVLYETVSMFTPISKEIEFMQNYLRLMRIRYPADAVAINVQIPPEQDIPRHAQLPPLLFLSFLENAFKHGISYKAPSYIRLSLDFPHNTIVFTVVNSYHPQVSKDDSGFGMSNVRKRLDLIYGNRYQLQVGQTELEYSIVLTIPASIC